MFVFVRTLHQRYCLFRSKVQERLVSYLLVVQSLLQLFYSHHHLMELLNTRFDIVVLTVYYDLQEKNTAHVVVFTLWSIGSFWALNSVNFLSERNWQWLPKPHCESSGLTRLPGFSCHWWWSWRASNSSKLSSGEPACKHHQTSLDIIFI